MQEPGLECQRCLLKIESEGVACSTGALWLHRACSPLLNLARPWQLQQLAQGLPSSELQPLLRLLFLWLAALVPPTLFFPFLCAPSLGALLPFVSSLPTPFALLPQLLLWLLRELPLLPSSSAPPSLPLYEEPHLPLPFWPSLPLPRPEAYLSCPLLPRGPTERALLFHSSSMLHLPCRWSISAEPGSSHIFQIGIGLHQTLSAPLVPLISPNDS